jgi:heme/copper-type cytochrome/quinol oxidase subunit 2
MKEKNNRKIILGIGIILSFALLILSISLYFSFRHNEREQGHLTPEMIEELTKEEIINYMQELIIDLEQIVMIDNLIMEYIEK